MRERCEEREPAGLEEGLPHGDRPGVVWINVVGLHQVDIIEKIGNHFNWHPLMQEDILNAVQRPKIDDYEDYLCIILKMLSLDGEKRPAQDRTDQPGPGAELRRLLSGKRRRDL